MGKHRRTEDLNNKPFDPNATPEVKAKEFDQQWGHNRRGAGSTTPALDAYEKQRKNKG
ncbi:hypothetical protein HWB40_gp44 [Streptomyces phage Manuel]|uniref:Uncharacterized protein n=1 Tax=Streptomyces phage Manuel TaxID=2053812 RepID=A0A2H4PR00_9CAUD|nr:hypothetical protein HWB40_gp44 [Streptomyces phage Manuel]ATW69350.1 hypothetical protein SEA_MANUEL_53 [Streptomyces phage Manuel]